MTNKVSPRHLTPNAHYKATHNGNHWYVRAKDTENVVVLWKNGKKLHYPESGSFSMATLIEVPETVALSGGRVQTNKEAVVFLDNDY